MGAGSADGEFDGQSAVQAATSRRLVWCTPRPVTESVGAGDDDDDAYGRRAAAAQPPT